MHRGLPWLIAALAFTSAGCRRAQPPPQPQPPLVAAVTARAADVPVYLDEIGRCTASEMVSVRPQASGQITRVHFVEGQDVRAGDVLFTIDPAPYQAALNQAQAQVVQSQAVLTLAQQEFRRVAQLVQTSAVSTEEYESRQNAVAVAQAQLQAAEAAVATAQVNLAYTTIASPIDGRTGINQVDPGNVVAASGATVLVTIQRLDPIYADFTITERDLPEVRRQMGSGVLQTLVTSPADPYTPPRAGKLTFLDNAVQEGTGTVRLRATLPNSDHAFWPGQFVQVRLILDTIRNAVLIPSAATQISQQGPYVFVVTGDSKAGLRNIKVGQRQGDEVVVSEGLSAGERVVTSGQLGLSPGMAVRAREATAGAVGGGGGPSGSDAAPGASTAPAGDQPGARGGTPQPGPGRSGGPTSGGPTSGGGRR